MSFTLSQKESPLKARDDMLEQPFLSEGRPALAGHMVFFVSIDTNDKTFG